jgi:mannose-6-phosphate isomerase-like protein (cupin superfamily)
MLKKFQLRHISDIPYEGTHDLPNTRQTLATKEDLVTNNIDALTKGILPVGKIWDWHKHQDYDELCVVLKGEGVFYWGNEIVNYKADDVLIIPAQGMHKFEATGSIQNEFYFVRIKV